VTRVSVVVCTFDRPDSVARLIAAVDGGRVPLNLPTEVVVADNSPDGRNLEALARLRPMRVELRCVAEPRPGKCTALNTALGRSRGEIILLTDDDCLPPADWIEGMCRPIAAGRADVVGGGVVIPPELRKPWMGEIHRTILLDGVGRVAPAWRMIGANAAFSRAVLEKVPAFDQELGPAGTGAGEDSLFFAQMREAGYRSVYAGDEATVVHRFDPFRLTRVAFLRAVAILGRSEAYIDHHWEHRAVRRPRLKMLISLVGLWAMRLRHPGAFSEGEGIDPREFHQLKRIHFFRQIAVEQRRPRAYARHGLRKLEHRHASGRRAA